MVVGGPDGQAQLAAILALPLVENCQQAAAIHHVGDLGLQAGEEGRRFAAGPRREDEADLVQRFQPQGAAAKLLIEDGVLQQEGQLRGDRHGDADAGRRERRFARRRAVEVGHKDADGVAGEVADRDEQQRTHAEGASHLGRDEFAGTGIHDRQGALGGERVLDRGDGASAGDESFNAVTAALPSPAVAAGLKRPLPRSQRSA